MRLLTAMSLGGLINYCCHQGDDMTTGEWIISCAIWIAVSFAALTAIAFAL